jgi:lipopolysaccharide transport system ATP-binding protein
MNKREIIRAERLGKSYLLGHASSPGRARTFREAISKSVRSLGRSAATMARGRQLVAGDEVEEFWALRDLNFSVTEGDVVGIIGRNGAGKSTLLKILSRITDPSEGRVEIKGRVASLLEVGTGFHQELTGRENIFLNGAILGMTRSEIRRKLDEIVDFSGVEKFLDTPIKRYSSGMSVRLAFSVAAHLEPEILVVDEVLAVGDAEFQRKCLGKMSQVATQGRTVLFVSHNMSAVSRLCKTGIFLSGGRIKTSGEIDHVIESYYSNDGRNTFEEVWEDGFSLPGIKDMAAMACRLRGADGIPKNIFEHDETVRVEIDYDVKDPIKGSRVGFYLTGGTGDILFESYDTDAAQDCFEMRQPGRYTSVATIPANLLNAGQYFISVVASCPQHRRPLVYAESVLSFTVTESNLVGAEEKAQRKGVIRPVLSWTVDG